MTENVYRYQVREVNSGETEERLICGETEELRNEYATKSYEDDEQFRIVNSGFAGEIEVFRPIDFSQEV